MSNEAVINEELHPHLMIAKLRKEIGKLKETMAASNMTTAERDLTEDEKKR